ncbi:hypothetical protein BX616_010086, partial [Lobosporangium transversale]
IDYLTIYDGPDTSSPVIAKLCGNIWMDSTPTIYSSGPDLTAVFTSQERTPGSFEAAVFKDFTPRSQHAMAYDAGKDMVFITGGTSSQTRFMSMSEILTYSFATNKWNKITVSGRGPDPRYGHFSFIYNDDLYVYGGITSYDALADVWKYNGKQWSSRQPLNPDQLPTGRAGASCVLVTQNNVTRLVVFGGLNAQGETVRELNMYDIETGMWKRADHQNSVGLAGATAVYHEATESIYFFGGMVNQTTRNTITYQYYIQHDLWYALAPRIDPLTSQPVPPYTDTSPNNPDPDDEEELTDAEPQENSMVQQYLPPVMYDQVSGVWAPAGLMGDDMVLIYGGMKPFGLGLNVREQSCYVHKITLFDMSCQNWTTYDMADVNGVIRDRVNHTMVLRPPGAPGGSKTAWTAYIFGGFNGYEHQDVVNITINLPARAPADVNNCRALRWCSLYDDCQNCNPNYCSYVGGLCLFDTDKAKLTISPTGSASSPLFLLGTASDIPKNGTLQDLIRQRPDLKDQVLTSSDTCPSRVALDVKATYSNVLQPGQEMTFKTYIDSLDPDIQFEVTTEPATAGLHFRSQNVWEGFMNMYWRASHGLTDDSWNGYSETSSPTPSDIPPESTQGTFPVITPMGILNVSELYNRWTRFSGLDASPSSSALYQSTDPSALIDFPAGDPRRFSGYHVYSLKNPNSEAVAFSLTVHLLDHPVDDHPDKGSQVDLATLGFVTVGFILGVLVLILVGQKVRKMMQQRDEVRRAAAEMRMLEQEAAAEEEEENRRRQALAMPASASPDSCLKDMKPMYRIIVGVQPQLEQQQHQQPSEKAPIASSRGRSVTFSTLRNRGPTKMNHPDTETATRLVSTPHIPGIDAGRRPGSASHNERDRTNSQVKPDYIRDLGSSNPPPDPSNSGNSHKHHRTSDTNSEPHYQEEGGSSGENWLRQSLERSTSLRSFRHQFQLSKDEAEDQKQLKTAEDGQDKDGDSNDDGTGVGHNDRHDNGEDHGILELDMLSPTDLNSLEKSLSPSAQVLPQRRRWNPLLVQPISIEPLVFHGGLVPRTRRHYRRYQRSIWRRQQRELKERQQQTNGRATPSSVLSRSTSRKSTSSRVRMSREPRPPTSGAGIGVDAEVGAGVGAGVGGTLREIHRSASKMTLRSRTNALPVPTELNLEDDKDNLPSSTSESIEMESLPHRGDPTTAVTNMERASPSTPLKRSVRMRGRQEYEPGPLLGMNVLIVFPGDPRTRPVMHAEEVAAVVATSTGTDESGSETIHGHGHGHGHEHSHNRSSNGSSDTQGMEGSSSVESSESQQQQRLPPMAIGTVFLPDPVRWWAYKAHQDREQRRFEREMRRLHRQQEQLLESKSL